MKIFNIINLWRTAFNESMTAIMTAIVAIMHLAANGGSQRSISRLCSRKLAAGHWRGG